MATNATTPKVLYETPEEREQRLQREKLAAIVKQALREVLDERESERSKGKPKSDFLTELLGG